VIAENWLKAVSKDIQLFGNGILGRSKYLDHKYHSNIAKNNLL